MAGTDRQPGKEDNRGKADEQSVNYKQRTDNRQIGKKQTADRGGK